MDDDIDIPSRRVLSRHVSHIVPYNFFLLLQRQQNTAKELRRIRDDSRRDTLHDIQEVLALARRQGVLPPVRTA
jgi:hypothetical protein